MANDNNNIQTAIAFDEEYRQWILQLCQRYRQRQIKAAVKVNDEMLRFYWSVGQDISDRQYDNRYGTAFYKRVSSDLQHELGIKRGFSETSIKYMKYFYELYSQYFINRQQPADKLLEQNRQQLADESGEIRKLSQLAAEFDQIFFIPWSHHQKIIDKVDGNADKAIFFVRKSLQNQWGRALLVNALSSDLYERQQSAQTNFDIALPSPESDLAKEYFHTPYNFEFTGLMEQYNEKQLKDALTDHITRTLIEFGRGFAFVGREYRLTGGRHEKFVDLLFYIIPLHRYCVVEVKTTEFDFPDFGQLLGYVAMVNDQLNTPGDNPAIGLLICQEKDNVLAQYALSNTQVPVSIAEYKVTRQQLPPELQSQLPTEQEIEQALGQDK